jgi:hypothetical protein
MLSGLQAELRLGKSGKSPEEKIKDGWALLIWE